MNPATVEHPLLDPKSKFIRRLVEHIFEAIEDDVQDGVEKIMADNDVEINYEDDDFVQTVAMPLEDRIMSIIGRQLTTDPTTEGN